MHPKEQIQRLAKIIKGMGWRVPITVSNRSGYVVRGHGRLKAAKMLQCKEAPVDFQDYESEAEEWADLLGDNVIAELAVRDAGITEGLLMDIDAAEFDVTLAGFSDSDIEKILVKKKGKRDPDYIPKTSEKPVSKRGDLWLLGPHRLLCGDCTDQEDVALLMGGKKADMAFTDPPYNMNYKSNALGGILNDKLSERKFVRLILASAHVISTTLREGGSYYICMSGDMYAVVIHQLRKLGLKGKLIVWVKPSVGLGAQEYRPQFECIVYGYTGLKHQRTWSGGRGKSNIWKFDVDRGLIARETQGGGMVLEVGLGFETLTIELDKRVDGTVINSDTSTSDVWRFGRENAGRYLHPNQKPVALIERAIRNSSNKGDSVFDLFSGSGATLIACEETDRNCYTMELDPYYCDISVKRWEEFAGEKAMLETV